VRWLHHTEHKGGGQAKNQLENLIKFSTSCCHAALWLVRFEQLDFFNYATAGV
jgi:hypothetical protein